MIDVWRDPDPDTRTKTRWLPGIARDPWAIAMALTILNDLARNKQPRLELAHVVDHMVQAGYVMRWMLSPRRRPITYEAWCELPARLRNTVPPRVLAVELTSLGWQAVRDQPPDFHAATAEIMSLYRERTKRILAAKRARRQARQAAA